MLKNVLVSFNYVLINKWVTIVNLVTNNTFKTIPDSFDDFFNSVCNKKNQQGKDGRLKVVN